MGIHDAPSTRPGQTDLNPKNTPEASPQAYTTVTEERSSQSQPASISGPGIISSAVGLALGTTGFILNTTGAIIGTTVNTAIGLPGTVINAGTTGVKKVLGSVSHIYS